MLISKERKKASQTEREQYQGMIGSLVFSMINTRPDIVFVTSVMSHFAKNLSHKHTKAVKTIIQYLKAPRLVGIIYGGEEGRDLKIKNYSDFN